VVITIKAIMRVGVRRITRQGNQRTRMRDRGSTVRRVN
jgi:hypothetical protein